FDRGHAGESQTRFEQAAGLAPDQRAAANALRHASGAAESRHFGDDALLLRRAAGAAAARAGDRAAAARDRAGAAECIHRAPGMMTTQTAAGEAEALLAEARVMGAGDLAAEARTLVAEAFSRDDTDPLTAELSERALTLARRVGDPVIESAALDE